MNEVRQLAVALYVQTEVVELLEEAHLLFPSPCPGWSVGDVLQHSLAVTWKFTEFAAGATDTPRSPGGDLVRGDHRGACRDAADASCKAWRHADMTRTCHVPFGTFTAAEAAGINLFDVLAHTADIAAAARLPMTCSDDLWDAGREAAAKVFGRHRDPRHYGPDRPVSPTATAEARFLAYLGRATSVTQL